VRRGVLGAGVGLVLLAAPSLVRADETVVVQPGDSLSRIAARELGNAGAWPLIYRANRDRIKDPERVYPGQELTVPGPTTATKADAPSRSEAASQETP